MVVGALAVQPEYEFSLPATALSPLALTRTTRLWARVVDVALRVESKQRQWLVAKLGSKAILIRPRSLVKSSSPAWATSENSSSPTFGE